MKNKKSTKSNKKQKKPKFLGDEISKITMKVLSKSIVNHILGR